jgi:hypothetical protein
MVRLAHLINPVPVGPQSDLYYAQPLVAESLRIARRLSAEQIDIQLLSAGFADEAAAVPDGFTATAPLERSILDCGAFRRPRRLPLLADLIDRLVSSAPDAEYLIYTNADIIVKPYFYAFIAAAIADGHQAFVINRLTIPKGEYQVGDYPRLCAMVGTPHPGYDCFVFRRDAAVNYQLFEIAVGAPQIDLALAVNMYMHAQRRTQFHGLDLTFHLGNDRVWDDPLLHDYEHHNGRELLKVLTHYNMREHPWQDSFFQRHRWGYDPAWIGRARPVSLLERLRRLRRSIGRRIAGDPPRR